MQFFPLAIFLWLFYLSDSSHKYSGKEREGGKEVRKGTESEKHQGMCKDGESNICPREITHLDESPYLINICAAPLPLIPTLLCPHIATYWKKTSEIYSPNFSLVQKEDIEVQIVEVTFLRLQRMLGQIWEQNRGLKIPSSGFFSPCCVSAYRRSLKMAELLLTL